MQPPESTPEQDATAIAYDTSRHALLTSTARPAGATKVTAPITSQLIIDPANVERAGKSDLLLRR